MSPQRPRRGPPEVEASGGRRSRSSTRRRPVRGPSSRRKQLERDEHDDIHKVLGGIAGVYLRDEDGYGLRPNIGMRGAAADRSAKITLMEDGVLIAPGALHRAGRVLLPARHADVAHRGHEGTVGDPVRARTPSVARSI